MREEWVRKVEAFVKGREGGVVGVVWRKSVVVAVGALGAAEHAVKRVAAAKNVRAVLEMVTENIVKGVLAAEVGARRETGLGKEAGRLAEGVVGGAEGVKCQNEAVQTRRKAAAAVAVALRSGMPLSGRVPLRTGVVPPATAKAMVPAAISTPLHAPAPGLRTATTATTTVSQPAFTPSPWSSAPSAEPAPARWRATLLRGGAAVLFAGAAAGAAGASLPGALTVSAVAMTAAAVTRGAEKRRAVGRASARAMFGRRSRVGRGVVRAVGSAGRQGAKMTQPARGAPVRRVGLPEAEGNVVRRDEGKVVGNGVIEAEAYPVGESMPKVLATPVVGAALTGLDDVAFLVEGFVARVARRLGVWATGKVDGWTMLGAFERRED